MVFSDDFKSNLDILTKHLNVFVEKLPYELNKMKDSLSKEEINKINNALKDSDMENKLAEFNKLREGVINQMNEHLR